MNARVEAVLSGILTICAVAIAGTFVYKQLFAPTTPAIQRRAPTSVKSWDKLLQGGTRIGLASAPVQIVEFGDFQCPFCRTFHVAAEQVMTELKDKVSLVYYHYPLPSHQYAVAAARAAACAAHQARFVEMARELFARQDSLGARPWLSYARVAGVTDTTEFLSCLADNSTQTGIDADISLGNALGIIGTPTIMVNGWRLALPPSADSLRRIAQDVVAGRSAFPRRR